MQNIIPLLFKLSIKWIFLLLKHISFKRNTWCASSFESPRPDGSNVKTAIGMHLDNGTNSLKVSEMKKCGQVLYGNRYLET